MNNRLMLAALIVLLGAKLVDAQSPVGNTQPNIFQESSTIAFGSPTGKTLLFEGRPALHLYALNQFGDQVWQKTGIRDSESWLPKRVAMATGFSFLPEIRMNTDRSNPVRTPSYRIRATHQVLWMRRNKSDNDGALAHALEGTRRRLSNYWSPPYAFERLLYRLGQPSVRNRFVLKGAMLLCLWSDQPCRATRDLDLLRRGDGIARRDPRSRRSRGTQCDRFRMLLRTSGNISMMAGGGRANDVGCFASRSPHSSVY